MSYDWREELAAMHARNEAKFGGGPMDPRDPIRRARPVDFGDGRFALHIGADGHAVIVDAGPGAGDIADFRAWLGLPATDGAET